MSLLILLKNKFGHLEYQKFELVHLSIYIGFFVLNPTIATRNGLKKKEKVTCFI
jgi:hypothetical protein